MPRFSGFRERFTEPPPPVNLPRESPQGGYHDFDHATVRYEAAVRLEEAPNPYPAATTFAGVGRDSQHATSRHERVTVLALSEWNGVMGWPFQSLQRSLASTAIPLSDAVVQLPIGFSPEIQMGTPTGVNAVAQAVPTGDFNGSFVGLTDPFAKIRR